MDCDVCCGDGRYPVITRTGKELYTIPCPECGGSGKADEEAERAAIREKANACTGAVCKDCVAWCIYRSAVTR